MVVCGCRGAAPPPGPALRTAAVLKYYWINADIWGARVPLKPGIQQMKGKKVKEQKTCRGAQCLGTLSRILFQLVGLMIQREGSPEGPNDPGPNWTWSIPYLERKT